MTVRDYGDEPFIDQRTSAQACHVCLHPRLVDEDQFASWHADVCEDPPGSTERNVGAILLCCVNRILLKDKRMALSAMQMVDCTPTRSRSSVNVASG